MLERIHQRSTKVMNGLEHLSMRKGLGLFGLEKRRRRENVINVNQYLKGGSKEGEVRLFSVMPGDKSRGNGPKLKHRGFSEQRSVGVTKHWAQVTHGRCGISLLGDCLKPSSDGSGQTCFRWPCLTREGETR